MSDSDDNARLRMLISGRVQGVFFRRAAADEACGLGLKGWARNRPDGTVEIVAEGRRRNLKMFAAWAHSGPPLAHVTEVVEEWSEFLNEFSEFRIR
jgi:acylphosphatase